MAKTRGKSKNSDQSEPAIKGPFDIFFGWDNGATGTWTSLTPDGKTIQHGKTPSKVTANYQRSVEREIDRVVVPECLKIFSPWVGKRVLVFIEKPMVMPARFQASLSAVRALEAQLISLEMARAQGVDVVVHFVNSLDWQKVFIPQALAQKAEHKLAEKKRKKLVAACKAKGKTKEETKEILARAAKMFDVARGAKVDILGEAANATALKLFPNLITDDADSVLIAEFARRKYALQ